MRNKSMQKTLMVVLAISLGNKEATVINEDLCLIVQMHWTPTQIYYSAWVINNKLWEITHAISMLESINNLQDWVDMFTSLSVMDKRWDALEVGFVQGMINDMAVIRTLTAQSFTR